MEYFYRLFFAGVAIKIVKIEMKPHTLARADRNEDKSTQQYQFANQRQQTTADKRLNARNILMFVLWRQFIWFRNRLADNQIGGRAHRNAFSISLTQRVPDAVTWHCIGHTTRREHKLCFRFDQKPTRAVHFIGIRHFDAYRLIRWFRSATQGKHIVASRPMTINEI